MNISSLGKILCLFTTFYPLTEIKFILTKLCLRWNIFMPKEELFGGTFIKVFKNILTLP